MQLPSVTLSTMPIVKEIKTSYLSQQLYSEESNQIKLLWTSTRKVLKLVCVATLAPVKIYQLLLILHFKISTIKKLQLSFRQFLKEVPAFSSSQMVTQPSQMNKKYQSKTDLLTQSQTITKISTQNLNKSTTLLISSIPLIECLHIQLLLLIINTK